jgi:putative ABC transport system ATP-binding protein
MDSASQEKSAGAAGKLRQWYAALPAAKRLSIGFVFQNFNLLPRLTLSQNVELPLLYAGWAKPQRRDAVATILQKLGIENRARHRPHEISGGQRQRAAIARALVKKPAFVLADEPTGNLDSDTTREILDIFDGLHREGITLLVITHEAEVASRATRRLLLRDGRFVDSPDSVNPQTASPS